ncbi:MAG: hypothetical protein JOY77_11845 [Alphaproteobacteria bacterium]|nr:hypothetical protein [Alphaproteobacteria bacterium]MBV9063602.1 hypothetical protein [Alphaproteobacteria bacterium]
MVRVVNFFCFALSALACLALYHVSEQTRVVRHDLVTMRQEIAKERQFSQALEAEWGRATEPSHIQQLAQMVLGAEDKGVVELASTTLLPRRGDTIADAEVRSASAVEPSPGAHVGDTSAQPGD